MISEDIACNSSSSINSARFASNLSSAGASIGLIIAPPSSVISTFSIVSSSSGVSTVIDSVVISLVGSPVILLSTIKLPQIYQSSQQVHPWLCGFCMVLAFLL